jgi:hypothetical protein
MRWFTFSATMFRLCRVRISKVKRDKIGNNFVWKSKGKILLAVLNPRLNYNISVSKYGVYNCVFWTYLADNREQ